MSLALKYRPRSFEALIGQEVNARLLKNVIAGGMKQQSFTFSGAWGSGKTTAARLFACAANCKADNAPCGECEVCSTIVSRGQGINYREVDGASYGNVDSIRAIQKFALGQPLAGNYQFVVIDEAHRVSRAGFDACLKIIEQPPPRTVFVFVTTEITSLPDTIRSRCVELRFRRIPTGQVKERLLYITKAEGLDVSDEAVTLIVDLCQGIMRDSILMLQRLVLTYQEAKGREQLAELLGLPQGLDVAFIECVMGGTRDQLNKLLEEAEAQGTDYGWLMRYMIRNLRHSWLHSQFGSDCPEFYKTVPANVALILSRDIIDGVVELGRSEFAFYAMALAMYRAMNHLRPGGLK